MGKQLEPASPMARSGDGHGTGHSAESTNHTPAEGYPFMSDQEQNPGEALTLTIPETARLLGISLSKTYEAARLGQIPTIRLGTRVLVSRRRLEEFVDGQAS